MTALGIITVVAATVLADWLVSPEMRRYFRARSRLRARARRPPPAVEAERLPMFVQIGEVTYSIAPTRDRFTPAMIITVHRVGWYRAGMGLVLTPVARNSVEIVGVK